ncbi:MAG TPA: hypothetical protein VHP83_27090 [Aggregatilineaceae bacterium]|nr:hypothetical protein [Aggregatilineaceae bacterium]
MKNGLIFCASWFVGSTAVGLMMGRALRRVRQQQFDYPTSNPQDERFLVIPADGPSYIHQGTWADTGLSTPLYRN